MEFFRILLILTLIILFTFILTEQLSPGLVTEGFATPNSSYWSFFSAPRSDIGPDQEDSSVVRDPRFFNDYANVSRIGQLYDFCRLVAPTDDPENYFFACALAGTDQLDSLKFRTPSAKDGFRTSYDDYMRDTNGDGRDDYCRILKWKDGSFQAVCSRATDTGFDSKEIVDADPPEAIARLLRFYDGCVLWLRFFGDLKDCVEPSLKVLTSGKVSIDETPRKDNTDGVQFLGGDQFLRIADSSDLSLGMNVPIRSIRAWMIWVYFDEFTNNAKFFDFGNGPGKDNVFLGILGKGDSAIDQEALRPICGADDSTVPTGKSGAQPVQELHPAALMKSSSANVDEFSCTSFEIYPRKLKPSTVEPIKMKKTNKATLIYEVWDKQSRKMRVKVNNIIPLQKWTHITVTAIGNDAFRPNIAIYVNGVKQMEKESGWLPATSSMSNCYIGKSNWANDTSQYENRDELFKGRLFDFRAYRRSLSEDLIQESYDWGKEILPLS
jgi:hypothetical protein